VWRALKGKVGMAGSDGLLSIRQLASRPIDYIFKLVAAGLAGPYVPNAVIGKMLRPFGCD
jgi:hypothetical protein